jgi:hypothetical protein
MSKKWMTLLAAVLCGALLSGGAVAAEKKDEEKEGKRTAPTIDATTGKRLNEAVEALNADQLDVAKAAMAKLTLDRLSPYERSRAEQILAAIASAENDYDGARRHLEAALASGGFSVEEADNARFQVAQLFMAQERWKEAQAALEEWFKTTTAANANAYYMLAVCLYQQDNHKAAIAPAEKAVEMMASPNVGYMELLLSLRLEAERWNESIPLLEQLIGMRPEKKSYWLQLSQVYRQVEKHEESLAVYQIARHAGLLTEVADLRTLAELQQFQGSPYRAAKLLDEIARANPATMDQKAWEKMANAWAAAREYDRSVEPLGKAAQASADGGLYVRLAEINVYREDWAAAVEALGKGLAKGGLKDTGNAHLLMGIALYESKKTDEALAAFRKAAASAKAKAQAEGWIRHLTQAAAGSE